MPGSPPATRRPLIPLANRLVYVYTFSTLIYFLPAAQHHFPPKKVTVIPLTQIFIRSNELQNARTNYFKEINSIRLALYGVNL